MKEQKHNDGEGNQDNDEKSLAFDDQDDLLVPHSANVAIDDPDGNGELALGAEPLPLDPNISKLKCQKKPRKIHDAWHRKGTTKPKLRKSTQVIPEKALPKRKPKKQNFVTTDSLEHLANTINPVETPSG